MEKIILKVRDLIDDNLKSALDIEEYLTSDIFTLTEENPIESTISVYVNGAEHNGSGQWSFDSSTNKLTVSGLSVNDTVEMNYDAYLKYSDTELKGYIRASFTYLSVEKYGDFVDRSDDIFPTPTTAEEYLIALIASILIKGNINQYRTPEVTLSFSEDMSKEKKIRQAIKQFSKTYGTLKYVDLSEELGEAEL